MVYDMPSIARGFGRFLPAGCLVFVLTAALILAVGTTVLAEEKKQLALLSQQVQVSVLSNIFKNSEAN